MAGTPDVVAFSLPNGDTRDPVRVAEEAIRREFTLINGVRVVELGSTDIDFDSDGDFGPGFEGAQYACLVRQVVFADGARDLPEQTSTSQAIFEALSKLNVRVWRLEADGDEIKEFAPASAVSA